MNEGDPTAIAGNQVSGETVHQLNYWGDAEEWHSRFDLMPPLEREVRFTNYHGWITFDRAEPGVVKEVCVHDVAANDPQLTDPEFTFLGRVLGVETSSLATPPEIDPDTLTPEEQAKYDSDPNNRLWSEYKWGEALGREKPKLEISIDPELAEYLYEDALEAQDKPWDQDRLAAELLGIGTVTGDRDQNRAEVITHWLEQHPAFVWPVRDLVDSVSRDLSMEYADASPTWNNPDMQASLKDLQQRLKAVYKTN